MASQPDHFPVTPAIVRKLLRDNQDLGRKLAQHEYNTLTAELGSANVFDLSIDFPNDPAPDIDLPGLDSAVELAQLPRLDIPLGTVAWHHAPETLPIVGIFCPDAKPDDIRAGLGALVAIHHSKPFARFLFLCESLRLVPLLGRYEFAYEFLGTRTPFEFGERLNHRFGMTEIRDLVTSQLIWKQP